MAGLQASVAFNQTQSWEDAYTQFSGNEVFKITTELDREKAQRLLTVPFSLHGDQVDKGNSTVELYYQLKKDVLARIVDRVKEYGIHVNEIVAAATGFKEVPYILTAAEVLTLVESLWKREVTEWFGLIDTLMTPQLGAMGARSDNVAPGFLQAATSQGPLAYSLPGRGFST